MELTIHRQIFIIVAISFVHASKITLKLPLTINPLLQDAVVKGDITNSLFSSDKAFLSNFTFSDIINKLGLKPHVEAVKSIESLVVLALAAKEHGLSPQDFEFLQSSKWSITISEEDFANVSAKISLPMKDKTTLMVVQEAMFKVLEKKFLFSIDEVAKGLSKSKLEIYSTLEPGWIDVVHFIIEKNILRLTQTYDIPPFYIAKSLNMTLVDLQNLTLSQLEVVLKEKLHIIKDAARRLRQNSSISGSALTVPSAAHQMLVTSWIGNSTIPTKAINKSTSITEQSTFIQAISKNGTIAKTPRLNATQNTRVLEFGYSLFSSSLLHRNKSTNSLPTITITKNNNENNTLGSMFTKYLRNSKTPEFTTSTTQPYLNSAMTTISASWTTSTPKLESTKISLEHSLTDNIHNSTGFKPNLKSTLDFAGSRSLRSLTTTLLTFNVTRLSPSAKETVVTTTWKASSGGKGVTSTRTNDPVIFIVMPVTAILVLVALMIGTILYWKNRQYFKRVGHNKVEIGFELPRKGLVESLENINKERSTNFTNEGAEGRPRTSNISSLETLQEADEADEREI